jgi:hypothetical protein
MPVEPNNIYKRNDFKMITSKMNSAKTAAIDVQTLPAIPLQPLSISPTRNASFVLGCSIGYARSWLRKGLLGKQKPANVCQAVGLGEFQNCWYTCF